MTKNALPPAETDCAGKLDKVLKEYSKRGVTASSLANALGVASPYLSDLRRAQKALSLQRLVDISDALQSLTGDAVYPERLLPDSFFSPADSDALPSNKIENIVEAAIAASDYLRKSKGEGHNHAKAIAKVAAVMLKRNEESFDYKNIALCVETIQSASDENAKS